MPYPSVVASLNDPASSDRLNSPSHSALHQSENTEIEAIETFVGTLSSTAGTLIYDIRSANSNGGGHVQTANKGGTGQTSYTKGDILVATSASVLTKLSVGTDGQALVANSNASSGINWGSGNVKPTIRVYNYSSSVQTWSKPSTLSYLMVELVGGGGGGGGATNNAECGGGGGAGGYARKMLAASILGSTEQVWVGVGGTAGAGTGGAGGNGGNTIFGATSIVSASGGTGGGTGSSAPAGGAGGVGAGGDLNVGGEDGGSGFGNASNVFSGFGGSNPLGGGGKSIALAASGATIGEDGNAYGGGGSGSANQDNSDKAGGAGANGVAIIYEY